jgi:hypothetical protein
MNPERIYMASPYTAPTVEERSLNTGAVMVDALRIMLKGHAPFVPHLTHYLDQMALQMGIHLDWTFWMAYDDAWLQVCDSFLYRKPSRGADIELAKAQERGLKIYRSFEEIPDIPRVA